MYPIEEATPVSVDYAPSNPASAERVGPGHAALDHADLFLERDDVLGKEAALEAALRRLPGVSAVHVVPFDTSGSQSIEACVRVDFDPQVTNPVIIRDALAGEGYAVLSAAEHP
jgi:hypothetical protein